MCIHGAAVSKVSMLTLYLILHFRIYLSAFFLKLKQHNSSCTIKDLIFYIGRLGLGNEEDYATPQKVGATETKKLVASLLTRF